MSSSNCCFLTCTQVSQKTSKWSGTPISLRIFHNWLWFIQWKQKYMFFWNSFAFSMIQWMLAIWSLVPLPFLNTACTSWKLSVHILPKPSLKDFEPNPASMWNELNCMVAGKLCHCPFSGLEWKLTFSSPVTAAEFSNLLIYLCSTLTASSFRIWNSLVGIPSPPVALFTVMLPKAHWLWIPGCLALGEWWHHHGYLGHLKTKFLQNSFLKALPSAVHKIFLKNKSYMYVFYCDNLSHDPSFGVMNHLL